MISAAAVALIAGTGFANAQGTGMGREGSPAGSTAQQSAPSTDRGNSAAPANRDATESTGPSSGKKAQTEKSPTAGKNQRADENLQGQKSKSMSSDNERAKDNLKGGSKEMKAEGREERGGMKAEGREERNGNMKAEGREDRNGNMKAEGREDRNGKMNAETKGTETRTQSTVGQAGAGAKLSTEQRTRITTIIRDQHVQSVGNVDFDIRPGIRITRDRVSLRPLPSDVVTIYPEWRGYEFFLVNNRIVVVDPRTLEIVDVIDV
jgi:hypothetical protein